MEHAGIMNEAYVRRMSDVYGRADGRFMFARGNGATPDTPIASLETLFDEALTCGSAIREERGRQ